MDDGILRTSRARVCEASPLGRLSRRLQANRLSRQYPNVMVVRRRHRLEQYKWGDEKANPKQELVLPFIRMVAGPMDFTPGAMNNR